MQKRLTALAALTLAAGLAAPAPAADAPPLEINAILSTTGPAAVVGIPLSKGVKVLEDTINAQGGINGRPVKIVVSDDQSSPQVAVQLVNALKARNVPVILGPMSTASCNAVAPLVAAGGPVSYCVSPYIDTTPGSMVFSGGPKNEDAAIATLRYFRLRGFKRFAMLNSTDASGAALDRAFDDAFRLPENKGLTVVSHQHFSPADTSTAAQMAQIKAASPQVLISWMIGSPFATVLRGAHDAGLDIPIMTNGANMSAGFIKQLAMFVPKELDFAAFPGSPQLATSPGVAAAQAVMNKAFAAAQLKPEGNVIGDWDLGMIVAEALRRLPADPSAEQVRVRIAGLKNFAVTNAVYDFPKYPQRGVGQDGSMIARWNAAIGDFAPASNPGGVPLHGM